MIPKTRLTGLGAEARIAQEIEAARAAGESWAMNCLNCAAELNGHFCSSCGQRVVPPNPTMHELAGEAFAEFSGWDGKVAETARLLITKPGALTCEYLAGRRARYIQPVRLYLTFSVLFFVLAASTPGGSTNSSISFDTGVKGAKGVPTKVTVPISGQNADVTPEQRQKLLAQAEHAPALVRPMARKLATDRKGFQHGVFEAMPKGLFILLPVFAAILALFFWGRHFTEHLYFALHLHAFTFLALSLNSLLKFAGSPMVNGTAGFLVLVWIMVYAHLAFRRVYGQSHIVTLLKELGILALYLAAMVPTIVGVALWVAAT